MKISGEESYYYYYYVCVGCVRTNRIWTIENLKMKLVLGPNQSLDQNLRFTFTLCCFLTQDQFDNRFKFRSISILTQK